MPEPEREYQINVLREFRGTESITISNWTKRGREVAEVIALADVNDNYLASAQTEAPEARLSDTWRVRCRAVPERWNLGMDGRSPRSRTR